MGSTKTLEEWRAQIAPDAATASSEEIRSFVAARDAAVAEAGLEPLSYTEEETARMRAELELERKEKKCL